jgi:hypothetical protein
MDEIEKTLAFAYYVTDACRRMRDSVGSGIFDKRYIEAQILHVAQHCQSLAESICTYRPSDNARRN